MRASNKRTLNPLFLLGAAAAVAVGCSKDPLVQLAEGVAPNLHYVSVDAHFCTSPSTTVQQKIKYVFILDRSSSNQPGFPLFPDDVSSTDPTGSRRFGPLAQFIRNLQPDPNNQTSFALIDFSNSAWEPLTSGGTCTLAGGTQCFSFVSGANAGQNFLNNVVIPDWIGNGIPAQPEPADAGFTNYVDALQAAYNLIDGDAHLESGNPIKPIVKSIYQIIFVSDGSPTIASTNPGPTYTQQFVADIQPILDNIINLKNDPVLGPYIGNIAVNTGFYLPTAALTAPQQATEANAEQLLQQMATYGNGLYQQYGAGQAIAYQVFAPPIRHLKLSFQDLFVENVNAVWWDDGQLYLDSDGDGLPDVIEMANKSNPLVADTDGNGVNDLVEYRMTGHPCADANCAVANRNPYSICDGLTPSVDAQGNVTYPDTDGDGLNDCEEFVLKSDRINFDSNGDFVPDLLEFKNSIPFIAGTTGAMAQPLGDGVSSYAKLKAGLPISVQAAKVFEFQTRVTQVIHDPTANPPEGIECYDAQVNNVAALGPGNTIKISLVQNTSVVDDNPILLTAVRALNGEENLVTFQPGDFK